MRAAVYLRVSQDRTGDEDAVDRQREDAAKLITARGWETAGEFVDNDMSAAGKRRRPRFEAMMSEIEAGRIDVVIGWTLDRVCRTPRERLRLLELGKARGLVISLARGSDMNLSTPAGRLAADILGAAATHEIEVKSDRQQRANLQAAQQGRRVGGRKPFGYTTDGMTLVPAEARAVREGYAALLAGDTLRSIARDWNARGLTGQRSPWRSDSVRHVLSNPRNAGLRAYHGEIHGPAAWPAIVPEETWRAALAVLAEPARRTGGAGPAGLQLLTGIAYCGAAECELTVQGGGATHKKPIYRCRSVREQADRPTVPVAGPHVSRLAEPADKFVTNVVIARLSRPDARDLLVDHERPDVPQLRDQATALRARLDGLATEFADGDLTPSQLRTATERLRTRITDIEAQLADAGRTDLLGPLVTADDVRDTWTALNLDRKRAVINTLMTVRLHPVGRGSRTFRPETVEITWKTDDQR